MCCSTCYFQFRFLGKKDVLLYVSQLFYVHHLELRIGNLSLSSSLPIMLAVIIYRGSCHYYVLGQDPYLYSNNKFKKRFMATVKLKFRPSSVPEAEGTLYYQMIHKRKKCISTEHHIYADEWDDNTETIVVASGSERKGALALMQCKIDWTLKRWQTILDSMERSHKDYTVEELCKAFCKEQTYKTVFVFLQEQVTKKEQMKRQGTARTYGNAYRRFRAFREDMDLTFNELTPYMIECYEA